MPDNISMSFPEATLISDAARQAGLKMNLVCGGKGRCGKCKVTLEHASGGKEGVLACQEKIINNCTVHIPASLLSNQIIVMTKSSYPKTKLDPFVKKYYADCQSLTIPDIKGDWERLKSALGKPALSSPPLSVLRNLSQIIRNPHGCTIVVCDRGVLAIEEGDTTGDLYGMAIDIGTTTVASYLIDLNSGNTVAVASSLNKQNQEGADVMSRIKAAEEGRLDNLHQLIIETINDLIAQACLDAKISPAFIYSITLVGNTTMQHLLLGLSPKHLGRTPFSSTHLGPVAVCAEELHLNTNSQGHVKFLPLISGFVGADTTAVILATGLNRSSKLRLAIDIGTNGEIVLGNSKGMIACSTAAGPALEGAGITFGMRAAPGAIEDVVIENDSIQLKVIGNSKPLGICGSGFISAVAEMLKSGVLHPSGRLRSREEFLHTNGNATLAERLIDQNGERRFILGLKDKNNPDTDIYLSQKDIRALQLAKGAIYTGISLLLDEKGISGQEIFEILLAGAFGSHIDIEKAKRIGLLPAFPGVPVKAVGNAAGAGAQKALISRRSFRDAQKTALAVQHLDLASHPKFQIHFIKSLTFPEVHR